MIYHMPILKSEKQEILERQGCVFQGQEFLNNHELDPNKDCYCGRPNNKESHNGMAIIERAKHHLEQAGIHGMSDAKGIIRELLSALADEQQLRVAAEAELAEMRRASGDGGVILRKAVEEVEKLTAGLDLQKRGWEAHNNLLRKRLEQSEQELTATQARASKNWEKHCYQLERAVKAERELAETQKELSALKQGVEVESR